MGAHNIGAEKIMNRLLVEEILFNEAYKADPTAMRLTIANRIPCTKELGEYPMIPSWAPMDKNEVGTIGALDLVNAVLFKLTGESLNLIGVRKEIKRETS
jgi:hypothetical protein